MEWRKTVWTPQRWWGKGRKRRWESLATVDDAEDSDVRRPRTAATERIQGY